MFHKERYSILYSFGQKLKTWNYKNIENMKEQNVAIEFLIVLLFKVLFYLQKSRFTNYYKMKI